MAGTRTISTAAGPHGVGARIRAERLLRDWTQAELGRRAGWSRPVVAKWEAERSWPSLAALLGLARAFGCTVDSLLGYDAERERWARGLEALQAYQAYVTERDRATVEAGGR